MSDAPDWPISVLSDFFFSKATHHQTVVFESVLASPDPAVDRARFLSSRVSHHLFPNLGAR